MQIVIATKNKGKIIEIKRFFNKVSSHKDTVDIINWLTFLDFKDFPDVKEGSKSFLENAKKKAREISEYSGMLTLADDSGLEVDVLGGKPGVISSVYAGPGASDKQNRKKLLDELKGIDDLDQRRARFICKMVLWEPDKGLLNISAGVCEGKIGYSEKGTEGFGYDPIFIPEGYDKTMAQLSQDEKNRISHRGKALRQMSVFIATLYK